MPYNLGSVFRSNADRFHTIMEMPPNIFNMYLMTSSFTAATASYFGDIKARDQLAQSFAMSFLAESTILGKPSAPFELHMLTEQFWKPLIETHMKGQDIPGQDKSCLYSIIGMVFIVVVIAFTRFVLRD